MANNEKMADTDNPSYWTNAHIAEYQDYVKGIRAKLGDKVEVASPQEYDKWRGIMAIMSEKRRREIMKNERFLQKEGMPAGQTMQSAPKYGRGQQMQMFGRNRTPSVLEEYSRKYGRLDTSRLSEEDRRAVEQAAGQ